MDDKMSSLRNSRGHGKTGRTINILVSLVIMGSLGACGGGGGGDSFVGGGGGGTTTGWTAGVFLAASTFAGHCAAPRAGSSDIQGTSTDENNFLRSYSDNTYLWYSEIVDRDPSLFTTPVYFDGLVTTAVTASGNDKDRFHFSLSTEEWIALSQSGASAGYGTLFALLQTAPPRKILVAFTDPGTPAEAVNLARGAEILTVDGVDVINGSDVDALNAALFPADEGESHDFTVRDLGSQQTRSFTMVSAITTSTPVQKIMTFPMASGDVVGYMLFNDHLATAERGLFDAVTFLKAASINDLIIDLRYNGGGFLDIASEFSYMIAGAVPTAGRTFELLTFNDKHPVTNPVTGQPLVPIGFHTVSPGGFSLTAGTTLPTLDLSRVFVLTGPGTCSASESIINSLRGVGVEVIQIGSTTCGKPYGFYATDNCGTTYFTIQFRGENELGFGDYADGFTPQNADNTIEPKLPGCSVGDDFTAALGDPAELRLAAALDYAETGNCPAASDVALPGLSKPGFVADDNLVIPKSPWLSNRILRR